MNIKKSILKNALISAVVSSTAFNSYAFYAPDEGMLLGDFTKLAAHQLNRNIIVEQNLKDDEVFIYGASDVKVSAVFEAIIQANKLETENKNGVIIIKRKKEINFNHVINTYELKKSSETIAQNLTESFSWVENEYGYGCTFSIENETTLTTMCPEELTPLLNERMLYIVGQRKQILVKAHILETTNANYINVGMKYGLKTSNGGITYSIDKGILGAAMESLSLNAHLGAFEALMELSESESNIKTASRPYVLIESGKTGSINAVSQVAVATSVEDEEDEKQKTNIEYNDVGVMLEVEAEALDGNRIQLTISGELSTVDDGAGTLNPTFKRSKINTTTTIKSGELISLGGVITTTEVIEKSGIPLMRDIPWIGGIFGSEYEREDKKEMTIMLTAQIKD
ncbi:type II and III secretion system protein [Vibrio parahaemolyticus]|nr:type II and III secretion system protein [Vibrio parahaemolyticus]